MRNLDPTAFRFGFEKANKLFSDGTHLEEIRRQLFDDHTVSYCAGVQAFCDEMNGWASTPYVKLAHTLGLQIEGLAAR